MSERDDDLRDAFRSLRERYDGESSEPDATLRRALMRTRRTDRKRRITRWVVLPAAAALFASTAWAGATGKLAPAVRSVMETLHVAHVHEPSPPPVAVAPVAMPSVALPPSPPTNAPEPADEPAAPETPAPAPAPGPPVAAQPRPAPAPSVAPGPQASVPVAAASGAVEPVAPAEPTPSAPREPAAVASAADPHADLFAEAHRLHFGGKDPERALAAWNRYLSAAPTGRFAPEARYNRALTLVRLGRSAEARTELEAFANGSYGEYRRAEARALLDAILRDR